MTGPYQTLYLVGKIASDEKFLEWQFIGLFEAEEKALAVCRTPDHFLAPVVLNQDVGDEILAWPNFRYPGREKA
jgi:hypothetical protein